MMELQKQQTTTTTTTTTVSQAEFDAESVELQCIQTSSRQVAVAVSDGQTSTGESRIPEAHRPTPSPDRDQTDKDDQLEQERDSLEITELPPLGKENKENRNPTSQYRRSGNPVWLAPTTAFSAGGSEPAASSSSSNFNNNDQEIINRNSRVSRSSVTGSSRVKAEFGEVGAGLPSFTSEAGPSSSSSGGQGRDVDASAEVDAVFASSSGSAQPNARHVNEIMNEWPAYIVPFTAIELRQLPLVNNNFALNYALRNRHSVNILMLERRPLSVPEGTSTAVSNSGATAVTGAASSSGTGAAMPAEETATAAATESGATATATAEGAADGPQAGAAAKEPPVERESEQELNEFNSTLHYVPANEWLEEYAAARAAQLDRPAAQADLPDRFKRWCRRLSRIAIQYRGGGVWWFAVAYTLFVCLWPFGIGLVIYSCVSFLTPW